jgi:NADPH2 dehydrogenase
MQASFPSQAKRAAERFHLFHRSLYQSTSRLSFPHQKRQIVKLSSTMGSIEEKSKLFEPLQIGPYTLSSRIVMAPLTRLRADDQHVHGKLAEQYYAQRAAFPGTLLITEATFISPKASGYPNVPGIWSQEQIAAWKKVVDGVHKAGSYIFLQLWALGRTANPQFKEKEGTGDVVSSSPVPENSEKTLPRELTEEEIWEYVGEYAQAAKNAVEGAGFDGVGKSYQYPNCGMVRD